MHDLWLGCEGDVLHLDGEWVQPPMRGCLLQPGAAEAGKTGTLLTLTLECGSPPGFDPFLARLQAMLLAAQIRTERGLGMPVYLGAQPLEGGETWRTPVLAGWLEPAGSGVEDRLRGRMQVRLHLSHPAWYEGSPIELPLSNRSGVCLTGGIQVHNHADGGHDNSVFILGTDLPGEIPGGLKLACTVPAGSEALGDLRIGLNQHSNPAGLDGVLEAEAGSGGTLQPSLDCSGGSYRSLAWSGTAGEELLSWTLNAARVAACAGNAFRYLLRLASPVDDDDLWLRLRVRNAGGDAILGETEWSLVRPGCSLQELGPLPLPPGELPPDAGGAALLVNLVASRQQPGEHALSPDYLALVPLDGLRCYRSLVPLPAGGELVDEPGMPLAACLAGQGWITSHVATGAPLELLPGCDARLTFFQAEPGGLAPIGRSLVVRAWVRKRIRIL